MSIYKYNMTLGEGEASITAEGWSKLTNNHLNGATPIWFDRKTTVMILESYRAHANSVGEPFDWKAIDDDIYWKAMGADEHKATKTTDPEGETVYDLSGLGGTWSGYPTIEAAMIGDLAVFDGMDIYEFMDWITLVFPELERSPNPTAQDDLQTVRETDIGWLTASYLSFKDSDDFGGPETDALVERLQRIINTFTQTDFFGGKVWASQHTHLIVILWDQWK